MRAIFDPPVPNLSYLYHRQLKNHLAFMMAMGLVIGFFAPILLSGQVISPTSQVLYHLLPWSAAYPDKNQVSYRHFGDVVDYYYPAIIFMVRWLKQGIIPLWNPTLTIGQPFISAGEFFLYPFNWLYLIMPLELAFTWHVMFRLLVAAGFTYLLGRELKLEPGPCLMAALAFTFNGFHIVWLGWPHSSETIFLPVLLWLILKALTTDQVRYFVILAFGTVILLAGGFLPVAGYILYTAMGFVLFMGWSLYQAKNFTFRILLRRTLWLGLAVVAGLLMSSIHLLPFLENLVSSGYGSERSQDSALYRNFSLPWWQLILHLIPSYYGGISTPYWGSVNLVETLGYVGVLPLALALISLGRLRFITLRTPGYLYSLILTAFSMGVIYGLKPLSSLITMLPGFQLAINTRLLGIAVFGLAFLGAYGLEFLQELAKSRKHTEMVGWVIGASFLLAAFAVTIEAYWLLSPGSPADFNQAMLGVFDQASSTKVTAYAALRQGDWLTLLWGGGMFAGQLIAGVILLILHQRLNFRPGIVFSLLIILITADLFSFAYRYLPVAPFSEAYPTTPALQMTVTQPQPLRFLAIAGRVLHGNIATAYNLQNVAGHSIFHPGRYIKYLSLLDPNTWNRREHGTHILVGQHIADFESRLVDLLGIQYILEAPVSVESLKQRVVANQTTNNTPVGQIYGSTQQGQTFIATADNFCQIDLLLATYARTNHQEVIFHLKATPDATTDLARIAIPANQITDNQWTTFSFKPINQSKGHSFYFYLESPASHPGDAITVWSTKDNSYAAGQRYLNGHPVEGDLTFRVRADSYIPKKFKTINLAPEMLVFENTTALPRAYAVPHSLVLTDETTILNRLQSSNFDPYQTVIVEESPAVTEPVNGFAFNPTCVEITHYEPNRVDLQVNLPTPGWVVLTDLNYPGWIAKIDGQNTKVYQANYLFRAVYTPAGQHIITFYFQPTSVIYGLIISLISLLGLLTVAGFRFRQRLQQERGV